jgi:hypothetical protein
MTTLAIVVVDVDDRAFERLWLNAEAKASERPFWVVGKAGVDFGRRSKANAKRLTCRVERLNSDS